MTDNEITSEENIDYGIAKIQALLVETLDELDSICRDNNIHYSLHGGTLLGAERNHKLIPWDDDIDVSMTRMEYEKFKNSVSNMRGKYHLDEETMWFPRFVMKCDNELAYIDILIWDYISEKNNTKNQDKLTSCITGNDENTYRI